MEKSFEMLIMQLEKHIDDRLDRMEDILSETQTKGDANSLCIGKIEQRLDDGIKSFNRNDKQHEEFYKRLSNLESFENQERGVIALIKVTIVPIIIGVIVALFRSFMK